MKHYLAIDYDFFENKSTDNESVIIDVRESWEFEEFNEGGLNIPLAEIRERLDEVLGFKIIIVICANGIRSKVAAKDYCRAAALANVQICHLIGGLLGDIP
jgi:rhodanese-related sulfurtransferase